MGMAGTYQEQSPSGWHESEDANNDVAECHVQDCY